MFKKPDDVTVKDVLQRTSKNTDILYEFLSTNEPILEYIPDNHSNVPDYVRRSLSRTAFKYGMPIEVKLRNSRIYFVRTDI